MPPNDFPPTARKEIQDFFAEVIRARSHYLIANTTLITQAPYEPVAVSPYSTVQRPEPVPEHDMKDRKCDFCRTYGQNQPHSERDLAPSDDDISWLDHQIRHAAAVSFAAQRYHSVSSHRAGQDWVQWYQQFFNAVIGISVLGAGFTFGVVFNDFDANQDPRAALGAAWMLFVVSIGITSGASLLVHVHKSDIAKAMELEMTGKKRWWRSLHLFPVTVGTLIIQLLPLGAFLASAKAVLQYHKGIGIATLVVTSVYGALLLALWGFQNKP